jgi:SET domain-containing protein
LCCEHETQLTEKDVIQQISATQCIKHEKLRMNSLLKPRAPLIGFSRARLEPHEKSVFASRDIKANELITLYLADFVCLRLSKTVGEGDGFHVFSNKFIERFKTVEEKKAAVLDCLPYLFNINSNFSIAAHPQLHDGSEPIFLGHFINDSCLSDPCTLTAQEYKLESDALMNCIKVVTKYGLLVAVVAKQDIAKGQEITTPYGFQFWQPRKTLK